MNIFNNRGCFGGSPKVETPAPPPTPAPMPTPTPSEISPQSATDARKRRLDQMRFGMASTVRTTTRGLTGTGANLNDQNNSGKTKLGY